mmetsp:Transcript_29151/g.80036  ORF Transcript_29151/g.80036 Transcript_29151/m.80036 type:complete len:348 (+) Transcript_29151:179-1222(+)
MADNNGVPGEVRFNDGISLGGATGVTGAGAGAATVATARKLPWSSNVTAWQLLAGLFLAKRITDEMKPSKVKEMNEHFSQYPTRQWGDNVRTMRRMWKAGTLEEKLNGAKSKSGATVAGDATGLVAGMKTLGLDDDYDNKSQKTARGAGVTGAETIQSPKKNYVFKLKLPVLQFDWVDDKLRNRLTAIAHLPSGCYRFNANNHPIVSAQIMGQRKVQVNIDWTEFVVLQHRRFRRFFTANDGTLMFDNSHAKVVAHGRKVQRMKGDTRLNRVISTFTFETEIDVELDFTDAEGFEGFTIVRMGGATNPEIYAHMEFMGVKDGHNQAQEIIAVEDFCGDAEDDDDDVF